MTDLTDSERTIRSFRTRIGALAAFTFLCFALLVARWIAVVVENGGSGGTVAAPIVRKALDYYLGDRRPVTP